jgi:hypothetical protein
MANTKIPVELSSTPGIVDNSNATAITIDSSENSTFSNSIIFSDSSYSAAYSIRRNADALILSGGTSGFYFNRSDNSATDLYINGSGNVGIGTDSPAAPLDIKLNTNSTADIFKFQRLDGAVAGVLNYSGTDGAISFGTTTSHDLTFDTANTERMRIDASGNVGIGESSPDKILHLKSSGATGIAIESTTNAQNLDIDFYNNAGSAQGRIRYAEGAGSFEINPNVSGSTPFTILYGGNVGIGTDSPGHKLSFGANIPSDGKTITVYENGNIASGIGIVSGVYRNFTDETSVLSFGHYAHSDGTTYTERMRISSTGNLLVGNSYDAFNARANIYSSGSGTSTITLNLWNGGGSGCIYERYVNSGGAAIGSITQNGASAVSFNTSSDSRLKDVTGEARGLEVINELNPVSYNWKADGKADEGLIAQEVLDIVPNAVSGSEEDYYQMDYSKLVVHLVKGMKEQQAQIEALQSEINLLKGE